MNNPIDWKAYAPAWLPTPALVGDIELTRPYTPLSLDSRYRAARVLVRVHGQPVGYADIVAEPEALIDREQILSALDDDTVARAMNHLAADLVAHGGPISTIGPSLAAALDCVAGAGSPCVQACTGADAPHVTVAICTRDRAHSIGATLDSLLRQTYHRFEVLVVDNAPSDDSTERLIHASYPVVRYVREPCAGLDRARNRAIVEARGEILAYIDDDAIADPAWVASLVAAFDTPEVMCVTGLVAPARLDTSAQELFERFGYSKSFSRLDFNLRMPPPVDQFPYKGYHGTGCNSAFRRSVFAQVGLFDPRLDMGTPVPGGGDHDMFTRVIAAGHTLRYDPSPVVFHDHVDEMRVLAYKLGQYQQAFVAYLIKCALNDRKRALALLAATSWSIVRKFVRGLAAVAIKHDRSLSVVLAQAYYPLLGPLCLYRSHRQECPDVGTDLQESADPSVSDPSVSALPVDSVQLLDAVLPKDVSA